MPISKLLLAVVPALALLPATVRTNRGPAPLRTATRCTVPYILVMLFRAPNYGDALQRPQDFGNAFSVA